FDCTEKSDRHSGGFGDLGERKSATCAKTAKPLSGTDGSFGGRRNNSLTLEDMDDGGGGQSVRATQEKGALQQANVQLGVQTIAARGALRDNEPERFPSTKRGGRNTDAPCDFADAEHPSVIAPSRYRGELLSA